MFRTYSEIEYRVRNQRDPVERLQPVPVRTPDRVPRHQRIDVPIRQHDEPRPERGHDDVLQLVREIGGVEQAERRRSQHVPLLGLIQLLAHKRGAPQSHIHHRVSSALQPLLQERDLRGSPRAIRTLDHDQLAAQLRGIQAR